MFGDSAVVEMSFAAETVTGGGFKQQMCWVCQYEGDICVSLRLYVDTAAEKQKLRLVRVFENMLLGSE